MTTIQIGNGTFMLGDCFERMAELPDASVDMILADLPYGTTQCAWDSVLPFKDLWEAYWRVCRPGAAVVLTSAQPFTSALVMSQVAHFKYDTVWDKAGVTGHLNAKKRPLRRHEDILVFCRSAPPYFPEMLTGRLRAKGGRRDKPGQVYGLLAGGTVTNDQYYPTSIVEVSNAGSKSERWHPTQKPVALFEYLIRTYTNPGDLVLDNTAGSGTTAIAAENTGRRWVCIERDETYFAKAVERVRDAVPCWDLL